MIDPGSALLLDTMIAHALTDPTRPDPPDGSDGPGGAAHWVRGLPEKMRSVVASRMRRVYHADSALAAEAELTTLATELDRTHPGAAASLREGMAETLTVLRLNLPPTLAHIQIDQRHRVNDLDLS